jgi:hypothetical protein
MTTNLQEFMAIATLVTATTGFVAGFRYMIAMWERNGREEVQRRQPEWDALAARVKEDNRH